MAGTAAAAPDDAPTCCPPPPPPPAADCPLPPLPAPALSRAGPPGTDSGTEAKGISRRLEDEEEEEALLTAPGLCCANGTIMLVRWC